MRFILFLLLIAAIAAAWVYYPKDDPREVNPGIRDVQIATQAIRTATPGTSHTGGLFFITLKQGSGSTVIQVAGNGGDDAPLDYFSVRKDKLGQSVQPKTDKYGNVAATTEASGGYVAVQSKNKTYASVLIPPILVKDVHGVPWSDAEIDLVVDMPGWQAYSWSGGLVPEAGEDEAFTKEATVTSMEWDENTDANGALPPIQLTGVNLKLQQAGEIGLFISGVSGGLAGGVLLALITESFHLRRERQIAASAGTRST